MRAFKTIFFDLCDVEQQENRPFLNKSFRLICLT